MMFDETKPLFASKVFWFNLLTLVAVVANRQGEVLDPATVEAVAIAASTLGNVLLRFITSTKVQGILS